MWIRDARRAEADGEQAGDQDGSAIRRYIENHPWPTNQSLPPLEVQNKGLGPLQFWEVFGTCISDSEVRYVLMRILQHLAGALL